MKIIKSTKIGSPVPGSGLQHLQPCDIQFVSDQEAQNIQRNPYAYAKTGCKAYLYTIHPIEAEAELRAELNPICGPVPPLPPHPLEAQLDDPKISAEEKYLIEKIIASEPRLPLPAPVLSARSAYFDEEFLLQRTGLSKEQMHDGRVLPVLDLTNVTLSDFSAVKYGIPKTELLLDLAAWTAGTKNAGTGGDYPTIAQATNDRSAATGNCIIDLISAVTETAGGSIANALNGYSITFTCSAVKHLGIATAGYLISLDTNNTTFLASGNVNASGAEGIIIEWLNMKSITLAGNQYCIFFNGNAGTAKTIVRNIIIDGDLKTFTGIGFNFDNTNSVVECSNIKLADIEYPGVYVLNNNLNAASQFENLALSHCKYGFYLAGTPPNGVTCRNVTSHGGSSANWNLNSSLTCISCGTGGAGAIGAATESGTVSSVADTDYVSVDPANAGFLIPTGTKLNAGAAPGITGHTTYINEVAMASPYWIGAHGIAAAGGNSLAGYASSIMFDEQPYQVRQE